MADDVLKGWELGGSMNAVVDLAIRRLEHRDISACLALLEGDLAYPAKALAAAARAWRALMRDDALTAEVVETRRPGGVSAIVGFGAHEWAAHARRAN